MSLVSPHLILLHPPAVYDFRKHPIMYGPIADGVPSTPIFEMYPVGFFSILEHLEKNGLNVRIVNLAARMLDNPGFDVEKMIRKLKPKAFGIDFHWVVHAQGSLEVAKICKHYHPGIPVIFGGFSATYFFEDLIRSREVDFIIRGDSTEEPLLQLLEAIIHHRTLSNIPNLVWKDKTGAVHINPFNHIPNTINESNNYLYIFKSALKYMDVKSLSPWKGWYEWLDYPITQVITCRGCAYNCTFCGGSKRAMKTYCNRNKPAFRDPKKIVEDISKIIGYTRAPIFITGDLRQGGDAYAYTVLEGLKEVSFENQVIIELFDTAPREYFERVAGSIKNFNLEISPETHDEEIRKVCGKRYNNHEMEENIKWALELGCHRFDIFFMIGIPSQNCKSVMETVDYCGYLMDKFGERVAPFILPYSPFIDPGCIIYENPEKFGYKIFFKTLEEYQNAMLSTSWEYILNYETEWMTRSEIVDCTYRAGLRLNRLKAEYGLIDHDSFRAREEKIKVAIELTGAIREIEEINHADVRRDRLMQLKPKLDIMFNSVINEKRSMGWPATKRNLRIFNILKAIIGEYLSGKLFRV